MNIAKINIGAHCNNEKVYRVLLQISLEGIHYGASGDDTIGFDRWASCINIYCNNKLVNVMSCHHTSEVNVYKYGNITEGNDSIWEGLKSKF